MFYTDNKPFTEAPAFSITFEPQNENYMLMNIFLIQPPGFTEWILIIVAVLILFGGKKIPEFMRGLGKGIREFNDAKNSVRSELEEGMKEKDKKANSPE